MSIQWMHRTVHTWYVNESMIHVHSPCESVELLHNLSTKSCYPISTRSYVGPRFSLSRSPRSVFALSSHVLHVCRPSDLDWVFTRISSWYGVCSLRVIGPGILWCGWDSSSYEPFRSSCRVYLVLLTNHRLYTLQSILVADRKISERASKSQNFVLEIGRVEHWSLKEKDLELYQHEGIFCEEK